MSFFFTNHALYRAGVFAVRSVYRDAAFELTKTVFGQIKNKSIFVNRITNGSRIQKVQQKAESKFHENKNHPNVTLKYVNKRYIQRHLAAAKDR